MLRWIEDHLPIGGQWIPIPYTHSDIAQMLGASRETVTRLLSGLQRTRVLEMKRKRVRVFNLAGLRQTANQPALLDSHDLSKSTWTLSLEKQVVNEMANRYLPTR